MPIEPVSEQALHDVVEAREKHTSGHEAARSLGLAESTFRQRLKIAAKRGLYQPAGVPPGFEIAKLSETRDANDNLRSRSVQMKPEREGGFNLPAGHAIKGLSTLLDGDGRVAQQWIKTRAEVDPLDMVQAIKDGFATFEPLHVAIPEPITEPDERLALYPLPDLHMGLMAWGEETGHDWDLKIARRVFGKAIRQLVTSSPNCDHAIILGGGDAMHADSNENRTARSGNVLQVDGRYPKVLLATCHLFVDTIDLALAKHKAVTVRVLAGNHDEHASHAIAYFLLAWYRNEPRVTIDASPSLFWWHRFGSTLLGGTHGHAAKPADMPMIMANKVPEDWGISSHRYVHTFHRHHENIIERGGVIVETHRSPAAQDAWHSGMGFISGRSLSAIIYDRYAGEVARNKVAITD